MGATAGAAGYAAIAGRGMVGMSSLQIHGVPRAGPGFLVRANRPGGIPLFVLAVPGVISLITPDASGRLVVEALPARAPVGCPGVHRRRKGHGSGLPGQLPGAPPPSAGRSDRLRHPLRKHRRLNEPGLAAGGKTHAAQFSRWGLDRRSIPAEPRRFAPLIVAFRSKYTRASSPGGGSSLTRLVSRAPRPHRENSPVSALTWVSPQAVSAASPAPRRGRAH